MNKAAKEKSLNLLFILPALALVSVFSLYPIVRTVQLSFYKWDGIATTMQFVGFLQYKDIIFHNPAFWKSNRGYCGGTGKPTEFGQPGASYGYLFRNLLLCRKSYFPALPAIKT